MGFKTNMGLYFDRQGKPISLEDWASKFGDRGYKTVAYLQEGDILISTVWLGLAHGFGFGFGKRPLIFESMVFGGPFDQLQWRYSSEEEARRGHDILVRAFRENLDPEELRELVT